MKVAMKIAMKIEWTNPDRINLLYGNGASQHRYASAAIRCAVPPVALFVSRLVSGIGTP